MICITLSAFKFSFQLPPEKPIVLIAYELAQIPISIFVTLTRSSFWKSLNLKSSPSCFSFIFCCFHSKWSGWLGLMQLNQVRSWCLRNCSAVVVPAALCGVTRYLNQIFACLCWRDHLGPSKTCLFSACLEKLHSSLLQFIWLRMIGCHKGMLDSIMLPEVLKICKCELWPIVTC